MRSLKLPAASQCGPSQIEKVNTLPIRLAHPGKTLARLFYMGSISGDTTLRLASLVSKRCRESGTDQPECHRPPTVTVHTCDGVGLLGTFHGQ